MSSAKKDQKPAVYLVAGDDDYLIDQKARSIVDELCPKEEQALGAEIIDGAVDVIEESVRALAQCMEAVRTVGFFGGGKVVWLRNARFFSDTQAGKSDAVKAHVESLVKLIKEGLPEGQWLVISALHVDGRTAFYKACKAAAELIEFKTPSKAGEVESSARGRAEALWRELGLKPANGEVMELFLIRAGSDTRQIIQETEKLSSYLGADHRSVTVADVYEVVSAARESIAWDLADHVGHRQLGPALRTVRQLLFQREAPIGLIIGLEHRFRELTLLKECMRRKWLCVEGSSRFQQAAWSVDADGEEALSHFPKDPRKMHPYRTVKLIEQANRFSLRELLAAQQELARTHEQMVSSSVPADLLLEFLIIRLIGGSETKRAAS